MEKAAGYAPGLVGLVARGAEVHVVSLGRMAVEGAAMQRNSIFRILSTEESLPFKRRSTRYFPELANRRVLRSMTEKPAQKGTSRPVTNGSP